MHWYNKARTSDLTGRARVRTGWFGLLVLQIEVRTTVFSACPPPPDYKPQEWRVKMQGEGTIKTKWRDARWDDLYSGIVLDLVQPMEMKRGNL